MSGAPSLSPSPQARRAIVVAALLATYLQAVTISLPNAAVFHIGGSFSMTDDEIGWLFTAYIAASAVVLPMTRWLAGKYGRKATFQTSIILFAIGLLLATEATTLMQFLGARIVQGAASGTLAPLSLAIMLDELPPERHAFVGFVAPLTVLLGILSGPPLGGWLGEYHGWQSMFYAGLALSLVIFLLMALALPEKKAERAPPFDLFGLATLSIGLVGLQLVLDRGERLEWFASPEIRLETLASALGFYLYCVHILTAETHFLNKALFRDRNFVASTLMFLAFGAILLPTVALTSPMLEELFGYPADTTGYMTIPRSLALLASFAVTWRAHTRIDNRLLIIAGMALVVIGNGRMSAYSPLMDGWAVIAAGMVQGAGLGVLMPALTRSAFSTLAPALRPEGTALFNLARLYGGTIGIAVVQMYLYDNTQAMHLALAESITSHTISGHTISGHTISGHIISGHTISGHLSGPKLGMLNEMITGQAAAVALFGQFKLLLIVMLVASPLALLLRKPAQSAPQGAAQ